MPDWTPLGAQFLFCSNQKKFQATIGQFQRLKTIEHPYLAQYIDLQRGANGKYNMATFADHILDADRLFVISQQPQERVRELNQRHIAQLVLALDYLNQQGIVHHALSPSSLGRFCGELLLCDWGLFHMTDRGRNVLFPVPDLRYTAPEYIYCLSGRDCSFNPRADVWSLGMLLLEQKLGRNILSGSENQFERESDIERLLTEMRGLEYKLADGAFLDGLLTAVESEDCRDFIKSCLIFDPLQRPAPLHLLNHPYISRIVEMLLPELTPNSIRSFTRVPLPFNVRLNKDITDQVKFGLQLEPMCSLSPTETDPLYSVPLSYLYYMWRLTGGNLETELSRTKRVPMPLPSVERIPRIIRSSAKSNLGSGDQKPSTVNQGFNGGEWLELGDRRGILFDPQICVGISTDRLRSKLLDFYAEAAEMETTTTTEESHSKSAVKLPMASMSPDDLIFFRFDTENIPLPRYQLPVADAKDSEKQTADNLFETYPEVNSELVTALPKRSFQLYSSRAAAFTRLPLAIREQDSVYQYHRLLLFHQLLQTYPASHKELIKQARIDIPPPFRGRVWAVLLGVRGDYEAEYYRINKDTEHDVDRQLEVDIPRCHQYHPLLNNLTGHEKLRRILKAWCLKNPELVYWQGLDSLCAPFVVNNFNDEPLAFACLQRLIGSYLNNFFLNDNSAILQDHLAAFRQLITYHDPELNRHLTKIGFLPSLYAIPWFLTIFTHVLPLNKINHLWDVLFTLPVEPTFPLFIGLAILQNLRSALLGAEFNDCISLFQEISDMDIPKIMEAAWLIRQHTPNSIVSDVGLAPMERQSALNLAPEINGSKMSVQLPQSPTKEYRMEELNRTLRNYNDDSDDEDALKQQFGGSGGPLSPYEQSLRWWNRPTPAEVRLNEMVPRISLEDLLRMDQRACVIDLRSMDEFKSGHYPQSIGVHASDTAYFVSVLNMQRYRYFIIIAERGGAGPKFAEQLADSNVAHVAALNGGLDAVRMANRIQLCSCQPIIDRFGPTETNFWRCCC